MTGTILPIPARDRTFGTTVADRNTVELILAVREAFLDQTGRAPHVIISHLARTKLDPNREIVEAAQDDPFAEHTREHGARSDSEVISGIQIEHHFPGLRDTDGNRRSYAAQLARSIRLFMLQHYGFFSP